MAVHVIPPTEKKIHIESSECFCEPELKMDPESGEMVWVHNFVDLDKLLEDFIQI